MAAPVAVGPPSARPRWLVLVAAEVAFALLAALAASPRTALFWYIWPLFGLGACYLVQFRSELTTPWRVAIAICTVVSPVALALDWPFSGHVLWNVVLMGHAWSTGKRRSAWMALLAASLVYLIVMKLVSQTGRDVAGAGISVVLAAVILLVIRLRR